MIVTTLYISVLPQITEDSVIKGRCTGFHIGRIIKVPKKTTTYNLCVEKFTYWDVYENESCFYIVCKFIFTLSLIKCLYII